MAENEFEKRMQVKMEQFNVAPSPAVWQAVAGRVRKEKKRRFIFFWVLMGLFLGGAGTASILFINADKNNSTTSKIISPPAINNDNKAVVENQSNAPFIDQGTTPAEVNNTLTRVNEEREVPGEENLNNNNSYPIKAVNNHRKIQKNNPGKFTAGSQEKTAEVINMNKKRATNNIPDEKEEINTNGKAEERSIRENKDEIKPDSISAKKPVTGQKPDPLTASDNTAPSGISPVPLKVEVLQKKKWFLAITAGRSAIVNDFRIFKYGRAANFQSSPTQSPSNNRSTVRVPSFSLSAGLFFKQPLSNRVSLNYGFNYQFLSNRMHVGTRIDSNLTIGTALSAGIFVNRYYRPSSISDAPDHTIQYHFLGASAELSWTIIDKEKFTARWNNGFSLNRLIYSNNLQYEPVNRIYYKDTELMKKTQLFFQSSLEIPVGPRISISPFGSFSLTSVFKGSSDSAYRYTNYGIQLRIPLNKK